MKRTPLQSDPAKRREFAERGRRSSAETLDKRRAPLRRTGFAERGDAPLKRSGTRRRRAVSPASLEQRAKCSGQPCVVCGTEMGTHPMHTIDRSLGGDDDPRGTVPACFRCHRMYDEDDLDLLPYLEPNYREEVAYAVRLVGLVSAYRRLTNARELPA